MLLTTEQINAVFASDDYELQQLVYLAATHPYYTFTPRVDQPQEFDEQAAFCRRNYQYDVCQRRYIYDDGIKLKVCLGGTGSGKSIAAAFKTARHVLETPPPRESCPFWVVGEKLDQVCGVGWGQKLAPFILASELFCEPIWHKKSLGWPKYVILKHPEHRHRQGWVLHFMSYEQGIGAMKGDSIGGYWLNEEVPYSLIDEIRGRCRDYDSPGWADFTPIEVKSAEWPEKYEDTPDGWKFYHLNTELNTELAEGWYEGWIKDIPTDMRATRTTGHFSSFGGQVFKEFRRGIHVIDPTDERIQKRFGLKNFLPRIPRDWRKIRGLDFGFNNPTCCLWIAKDRDGRYFVYDEHYRSGELVHFHANEIQQRPGEDNDPHFGPTYSDHDAQIRAEYAKYGLNCTLARKEPKSDGIALLRSLMMIKGDGKARLYIFKHCENTIREIAGLRYPEGTSARNPADLPMDKDDHAPDALRMGIYSEEIGQIESGISVRRVVRDHMRHGVLLARNGSNGVGISRNRNRR